MLHHGVRPLTETELDAIERSPSSDELALDVPHSRLSRKGYFALPSTAVPRERSAVCSLRGTVRALGVVLLLVAALLFFSASTRSFVKGAELWRGSSGGLALPLALPPSAPSVEGTLRLPCAPPRHATEASPPAACAPLSPRSLPSLPPTWPRSSPPPPLPAPTLSAMPSMPPSSRPPPSPPSPSPPVRSAPPPAACLSPSSKPPARSHVPPPSFSAPSRSSSRLPPPRSYSLPSTSPSPFLASRWPSSSLPPTNLSLQPTVSAPSLSPPPSLHRPSPSPSSRLPCTSGRPRPSPPTLLAARSAPSPSLPTATPSPKPPPLPFLNLPPSLSSPSPSPSSCLDTPRSSSLPCPSLSPTLPLPARSPSLSTAIPLPRPPLPVSSFSRPASFSSPSTSPSSRLHPPRTSRLPSPSASSPLPARSPPSPSLPTAIPSPPIQLPPPPPHPPSLSSPSPPSSSSRLHPPRSSRLPSPSASSPLPARSQPSPSLPTAIPSPPLQLPPPPPHPPSLSSPPPSLSSRLHPPRSSRLPSPSSPPSPLQLPPPGCPQAPPVPYRPRLTVDQGGFRWDGQPVFLNGVNQAWLHYGNDFGGHQTHGHYCALRETLQNTSRHGGHAIRIWVHVEGDHSPLFDKEGFVVATDAAGTLIADLRRYLQAARQLDVLVFLVLWNGAVLHNQRTRGLFSSAARLQSYVERVLTPLAAALRAEPALGGWEVINEPEGLLAVSVDDPDGCFNATPLRHSGAGWAMPADPLSMRSILGFIGAQAAAIHRAAPGSLVTVGAWSERTVSGALGLHDFYTAKCLRRASGGQPEAYLDFLQVHSYASRSKGFSATSPFKHAKADYALKAPLVIGEFCPGEKAEGMTAEQLYQWAFDKQYDGGWGWTATSKPSLFSGMAELKNEPKVAAIKLRQLGLPNNTSDECDCFDEAPLGGETCQTYASKNRCGETGLDGFCCRSCSACASSCLLKTTARNRRLTSRTRNLNIAQARWKSDWDQREYYAFVEGARRRMQLAQQQLPARPK